MSVRIGVILAALSLSLGACATETVTEQRIVVAPHELTFAATDTTRAVSITHTCTCPFSWTSVVPAAATWLTVATSMQGDHTNVPVSIDRAKLPSDTSRAVIRFNSNFGSDSLLVTAIR